MDYVETAYNFVYTHLPPWVLIALVMHGMIMLGVAYMILLERKIASWVQDRIGPNRVGFDFGLFPFLQGKFGGFGQPLADGVKFILKEDYRPKGVDAVLFTLAPVMMVVVVIISIAVIPWGGWVQSTKQVDISSYPSAIEATPFIRSQLPPTVSVTNVSAPFAPVSNPGAVVVDVTYRWPFQIANLNIGVLYILAVLSLAVYGVVIGGWASNNKYSFLGGLRATANMISYEIPLGLSVLAIVVMFGTLDLSELVDKQAHYWISMKWGAFTYGVIPAWNVFTQPLGFILFLVCIHAEANRAPFDLAEAEQELVGGYHTEYSAMRFALFFLGEYAGMVTTSAVCVALFFGGWHLPWFEWLWPALRGDVDPSNPAISTSIIACIVRTGVFLFKTGAIIFIFMWVRWSLPRFRFDQLMMLAWRALIPISLALLMVTAAVVYFCRELPRPTGALGGREALAMFGANVVLMAVTMYVSTTLPPAPETNRKLLIPTSRYRRTPLPGTPVVMGATQIAPQ